MEAAKRAAVEGHNALAARAWMLEAGGQEDDDPEDLARLAALYADAACVQTEACEALGRIAQRGGLLPAAVVAVPLAALRAHAADLAVCRSACGALVCLTCGPETAATATATQALVEGGMVELVLQALRTHGPTEDTLLFHDGLATLCNVLGLVPATKASFAAAGGLWEATRAMREFPSGAVVRSSLKVVANYFRDHTDATAAGLVDSVASTMEKFAELPDLQTWGCAALKYLWQASEGGASLDRVVRAVLAGMRAFPADVDLQVMGVQALSRVGWPGLLYDGVLDACVAAMGAHVTERVLADGCFLVSQLVPPPPREDKLPAGVAAAAARAVVTAMGDLPTSEVVQEQALWALRRLCFGHVEDVLAAGGALACFSAMRGHPSSVQVLRFACLALCGMGRAFGKRWSTDEVGEVLAAMRPDPVSQSFALSALLNMVLCWREPRTGSGLEAGLRADLEAAAAEALRALPEYEPAHKTAGELLRVLALFDTDVPFEKHEDPGL